MNTNELVRRLTEYADQKEAPIPAPVESDDSNESDEQPGGNMEIVIPEDLSTLDDDALANLHSAAITGFNTLYGEDGSHLTDEGLEALSVLTSGIEKVQAEKDARASKQDERAQKASAMAAKIGVNAAEKPAPEPEPEDTFASKAIRVNLSGMNRAPAPAKHAEAPAAKQGPSTMKDIVYASHDFDGFTSGQGLDWTDIGRGLDRRLASFNRAQYEQANAQGRQLRTQIGLFSIKKPFDDDLVMKSNDITHIDDILQRAKSESRLPKGSLVASGGWCAPSETIYDLCELETRDGLFSLPEIAVTRGGIKYTAGPDFATIYNGVGFGPYTEAQDIAGDYDGAGAGTKPCYVVDCPDFTEKRLDFLGVCINAGLLMQRGYPEVIARTTRGALVAHDFKLAEHTLAAIVAGSTAVTMTAGQIGTAAPVLDAIEIQVEHLRTVQRLSRSTSLEAVFPFWVRGAIRSDLARRLGVELLGVSDSQINDWFSVRGVSAQFVYGLPGQDPTGGAAAFKQWPSTVKFLLYPAGTWVRGTSDIINLSTIYDSVNLGTNDFTALFSEEGSLVAKLCHDSRYITAPVCASGETGGGVSIACDGTAAP